MKIGTLIIKSRKGIYQINSTVDGDAVLAALNANPELAREAVASMIQDNLQRSGPVWEPLAKGKCESGTAWLLSCLVPNVKVNEIDKGEAAKWWPNLSVATDEARAKFFAKLEIMPAGTQENLAVSFARKRINKEAAEKAQRAEEQKRQYDEAAAFLTPDAMKEILEEEKAADIAAMKPADESKRPEVLQGSPANKPAK